LGNGNGTFQSAQPFPIIGHLGTENSPVDLVAADFTGDRAPELLTANFSPANSSELANTSAVAASLGETVSGTQYTQTPFNVTVTALNQFGGTFTTYNKRVHFTSSGVGATLPADY